jgi:AraC-like DNA-binding protein
MFELIPYLSFLTSGFGVLFITYLWLRFRQTSQVYGLIFIIFALVYLEFYIYALTSKHIYQMLFLLRTPNIVRAFLPIVLFLYVKQMVNPKANSNAWEYLHFVFPVLIFVGIFPDLLLSANEKKSILDHYYHQNAYFISTAAGWLPAGFVQPTSILVGIGYGLASCFLIYYHKKKRGVEFAKINKQTLIWLNLLSGVVTIYFLLQMYQYVNLFMNNSFDPPSQAIKCILGILLFTYFINSPNVQENMDGCIIPAGHTLPSLDELWPTLRAQYQSDEEALRFDQQVKISEAYLQPDFDLARLAEAVNIPPVKLSKIIKTYYGISFVELINRLRIHHFLRQRDAFDQYTLETFMYQSGFVNRSTFYAAFKKYIGVNPSFYLKELMK